MQAETRYTEPILKTACYDICFTAELEQETPMQIVCEVMLRHRCSRGGDFLRSWKADGVGGTCSLKQKWQILERSKTNTPYFGEEKKTHTIKSILFDVPYRTTSK